MSNVGEEVDPGGDMKKELGCGIGKAPPPPWIYLVLTAHLSDVSSFSAVEFQLQQHIWEILEKLEIEACSVAPQ
jgi:hypothetical protein